MSNIIGNLVKAVALLVGLPAAALLVYDTVAVRPHLAEIEGLLADADVQDAAPTSIVRDLIDANAGSPGSYAARIVMTRTQQRGQHKYAFQAHIYSDSFSLTAAGDAGVAEAAGLAVQ